MENLKFNYEIPDFPTHCPPMIKVDPRSSALEVDEFLSAFDEVDPSAMYLVIGDKSRPTGAKRKQKKRKKKKKAVEIGEFTPELLSKPVPKCWLCHKTDHISRYCKEQCAPGETQAAEKNRFLLKAAAKRKNPTADVNTYFYRSMILLLRSCLE
jgi:hypothetical protein